MCVGGGATEQFMMGAVNSSGDAEMAHIENSVLYSMSARKLETRVTDIFTHAYTYAHAHRER